MELFVESLLVKTMEITNARQARTLSPSHMRQCIMSEHRFDFLRELVKDIPNISWTDEYAADNNNELVPPPPLPTNGNMVLRPVPQLLSADRPKRSYQRPMSFDAGSLNSHSRQRLPDGSSASSSSVAEDLSPGVGILKRKLLDSSRKSSSVDGARNIGWKVAVLDTSRPTSYGDPREDLPMNVRSDRLSINLLPPTVNISTDSISSPIIKIDYSQPSIGELAGGASSSSQITPIINVDFSKLISAGANGSSSSSSSNNNNYNHNHHFHQKLLLHTSAAAIDTASLATPNLTTPTRLNYAPSFDLSNNNNNQPLGGGPSALPTGSALEMDEDYDNI